MDTTTQIVAKPGSPFEELGKIAWLWMHSPLHAPWSLDLLAKFALPPIELQQYAVLERAGMPVAYCSWAYMNRQAELHYMCNSTRLPLHDWNCGDRLWFIDWIAPFAKEDSMALKRILSDKFPTELARAVRVKTTQPEARVMHFKGKLLSKQEAKNKLSQYFFEFKNEMASGNMGIKKNIIYE